MDGTVTFVPLSRRDLPLVLRWLRAPHVRAWWRGDEPTPEDVEREYGPGIDATVPVRPYTIRLDGVPVGVIQCYRHADHPDWEHAVGVADAAGIDYFIGDAERCGQGLGSRVIAAFAAVVLDLYPEVAGVVAVPEADNRASRRALEKAGFALVGERDIAAEPSGGGPSAVYHRPRPA
jgi:RimJ/RimL family protein N-acetyltransferase